MLQCLQPPAAGLVQRVSKHNHPHLRLCGFSELVAMQDELAHAGALQGPEGTMAFAGIIPLGRALARGSSRSLGSRTSFASPSCQSSLRLVMVSLLKETFFNMLFWTEPSTRTCSSPGMMRKSLPQAPD